MGKLLASYKVQAPLVYDNSVITVTTGTPGTFTIAGHGLVAGDIVALSFYKNRADTSVPAGVWAGRPYYVRQVVGDSFKISTDNTDSNLVAITGTGTAGTWRLEKLLLSTSINITGLNSKVVRLVYKDGGISNAGTSIYISFNGVEDADTYYYAHGSASGLGSKAYINHSGSVYMNRWLGQFDISCNDNMVMSVHNFQADGSNTSNGSKAIGFGQGVAGSKNDSRFDAIHSITFSVNGGATASFLHGFTVEVWDMEDNVSKVKSVTASSNVYTLDLSQNDNFSIETTDAIAKTITFANLNSIYTTATVCVTLKYTNAASMTYPTGTTWKDNTSPNLTAGKTYILMFLTLDGGTSWQGSYIGAW